MRECRDCRFWSYDMEMDAFCVHPKIKAAGFSMGRSLTGLSSPRQEGEACANGKLWEEWSDEITSLF